MLQDGARGAPEAYSDSEYFGASPVLIWGYLSGLYVLFGGWFHLASSSSLTCDRDVGLD